MSVGMREEPHCRNPEKNNRDCSRDSRRGRVIPKVITDCGIKTNVLRA